MDEKVLIKSEMDKKARSVLQALMAVGFAMAAILLLSLLLQKVTYERGYLSKYTVEYRAITLALRGHMTYLIRLIIAGVFLLLGVVTTVIYLAVKNCEIIVTDKNVKGKTKFGKEVVLPLYMISSYSTSKFLSTISVSTASGSTKFLLIGNYMAIGNALSGLINERQSSTVSASNVAPVAPVAAPAGSAIDDLAKLKTLLDSGVITQEEFDAKKKQLLGL